MKVVAVQIYYIESLSKYRLVIVWPLIALQCQVAVRRIVFHGLTTSIVPSGQIIVFHNPGPRQLLRLSDASPVSGVYMRLSRLLNEWGRGKFQKTKC